MDAFSQPRQKVDGIPDRITVKWSAEVLDEGFVAFPKRLLSDVFSGETGIDDLRVVLAVADFRRPDQWRQPSLAHLAFLAGMGESEFRAALQRLQDRKLVWKRGTEQALEIRLDPLLEEIMQNTGKDS